MSLPSQRKGTMDNTVIIHFTRFFLHLVAAGYFRIHCSKLNMFLNYNSMIFISSSDECYPIYYTHTHHPVKWIIIYAVCSVFGQSLYLHDCVSLVEFIKFAFYNTQLITNATVEIEKSRKKRTIISRIPCKWMGLCVFHSLCVASATVAGFGLFHNSTLWPSIK